MTKPHHISRRRLLQGLGAATAVGGLGAASLLSRARNAYSNPTPDKPPKFLITIAASGGASVVDAMLAVRHSETANFERLNTFVDDEVIDVADSPFRAVDIDRPNTGPIPFPLSTRQSEFVGKHKQDLMVVTATTTSVNHAIAQFRSITGNSAWNGRTLGEAVAAEYGAGCPLPHVNMGFSGYLNDGDDPTLPTWAKKEPVANAAVWPLSLDGARGIKDLPDRALIDTARALRDDRLDEESMFARTFHRSEQLQRWKRQRGEQAPTLESLDLISRLNMLPDSDAFPMTDFGLTPSPDAARLQQVFPLLLNDPLEAQAALAFLLIKNRASVSVTIAPSFAGILLSEQRLVNLPLAFDYSHTDHRASQAVMWNRIMGISDRLIDLLKSEEFEGTGESLWDRSLIYVATDFGRSRRRSGAAENFNTGHDLNNGFVVLSPMVNGNTVLGGVDPDTTLTYGFDPVTGEPDPTRHTQEAEVYAGILQALGVSTTGANLPTVPAMSRS